MIIEDADRLTETAADALLKALEEPTARTVWMLCAPSSRTSSSPSGRGRRHVRLRTPSVEAVADLLVRRDGIDPPMARYAARAAQCHVGLARRLARDEGARIRRRDVIAMPGRIRAIGDAVAAAADLASHRRRGVRASSGGRARRGRAQPLLEMLGADPAARTQPPHVRAQLSAMEKEQKTRATRFAPRHGRPGAGRPALDLPRRARPGIRRPRRRWSTRTASTCPSGSRTMRSPEQLLQAMEAVGEARERINPTSRRCSRWRPWPSP